MSAAPVASPVAQEALAGQLGVSVFRNTTAQGVGRIAIAFCRLLIAGLIVRGLGVATFGAYALVLGLLAVAEWMADFGTTDVFVRDISREPARRGALLRTLTALKLFQVPLALLLLASGLVALRYPRELVEAGLVGGLSLVFLAGVYVCRVSFRVDLRMEREVAAELLSVVAMIPLVLAVSHFGGGLRALLLCHVLSRALFLALCLLFGGSLPSWAGSTRPELAAAARATVAMGVIGLLVGVYEVVDVVILSKLDLPGLPYYSGAQRIVWPVLMALGAIGATLYPVLACYWPQARERFEETLQRGIEAVAVLAGLAACALFAGAEFFLGLLGRALEAGAPALRVLALLCLVKAVSATVGPVLYVLHAHKAALRFIALAVAVKAVVIAGLAASFSFLGVAWGALLVEIVFSALPAIRILRRWSGYRIRWWMPARAATAAVVAGVLARFLAPDGGILAAALAPLLYVPLVAWGERARLTLIRGLIPTRMS